MRETCRIRVAGDLGGLELVEARHAAPRFGRHAHATYAIGVVTWGVNRFRHRGAWQRAPAGALCTVTPDEPHEVEPEDGLGFAYRCIYPGEAAIRAAAEAVSGRPAGGTLALPPVIRDRALARLVRSLFDAEERREARLVRETLLLALLGRAVTLHARAPSPARERAVNRRGISLARDYLAAHLGENVRLSSLAAIAGLDPFSLVRAFSRAYGLPPHAWLVQARVRRAMELLRQGRTPAETAGELGFSDQSHLTRHFKRLLGFTPSRYRRAHLAGKGTPLAASR